MAATGRAAISGVVCRSCRPMRLPPSCSPVAAAAVAHQLIDDSGRDAGILQLGGEGVVEVVRAVQLDCIE